MPWAHRLLLVCGHVFLLFFRFEGETPLRVLTFAGYLEVPADLGEGVSRLEPGRGTDVQGIRADLNASQPSPTTRGAAKGDLDLIGHVEQSLEVLSGKWKVHLLFFMARGVHRHSKLLACLPGASKKVMTDSLRGLERDGMVERAVFAEVPVRVEYSLTPLGWSMTEPLIALSDWGSAHSADVVGAREGAIADA